MRLTQISLGVLLILGTAGSVDAQPDRVPVTDPNPADTKQIVTIRGCLDGWFLTATDMPEHLVTPEVFGTAGDRFRIVGDSELLKDLADHEGHEVDIIGALLDDTGTTERTGVSRRIGERTRVWVGGTRRPLLPENPVPDPAEIVSLPRLDMRTVIHVDAQCPLERRQRH